MSQIEQRELGDNGKSYVRAHLVGVNVFCAALLDTFNSVPGEVFTLAPLGTPAERLSNFQHGGLLIENLSVASAVTLPDGSRLVPVVSLIAEQSQLLKEVMENVVGAVCIVDDFHPRWRDQTAYLGPNAFGVGDEVYHLLTTGDGEDDLLDALSAGNAIWHGIAAVCRVSPRLDQARNSTPSELQKSAASALLITCTAYDGEGFVAWRRTAG